MSRIRIVKGKITEIVGGDLTYFSESNISEYAAEVYSENSKKAIKHSDNPEKQPAGKIIAKCLVKFRPHDTYKDKPDFGFDWLREGDSGQKGDNWFGGIMGKYYESDNVTIYSNGNSWNNNFRKDMKMYDRKLRSYKSFSLTWKKVDKVSYLYPIPVLTLFKGKTATFNLKIEIQEKPKKLTFEFQNKEAEKYLTLNIKEIGDIRKGKYDKFNYFKITCKESFSKEQILYVKADGEICGAMRIHPNSSSFIRNINVVFIKVITDINGSSSTTKGKPSPNSKLYFLQSLLQGLVKGAASQDIELDCTGGLLGNPFQKKFCKVINGKYYVHNSTGMRKFLEDELQNQYGNKYAKHYKVFFIGEKYPSWKNGAIAGYTNGFSYFNTTFTVQFATHTHETVAHELLHAMCLPHTFDGISTYSKYTYEAYKTNNIMDYCHHKGIPRMHIYRWQWKTINNKIQTS